VGVYPTSHINPESLSLPDITEFAAGEHTRAYDLKPPLPWHFEQREKSIFCLSLPDITEFALRKSIVRALKIFHGLGLNWKI
jgi:hypothetical protein